MLTTILAMAFAIPQFDLAPVRDLVLPAQNYRAVRSADFDGDGDLDLVVAGDGKDGLRWHENLGAGVYDTGRSVPCRGAEIFGLDVGDMDGDGDVDIVHGSAFQGRVGWTPNLGQGEFGNGIRLTGGTSNSRHVRVLDFDSDGDLDVLSSADLAPEIVFFENLGGGVFAPAVTVASGLSSTIHYAIEDVDADGDLDLVVADDVADAVVLLERTLAGFLPPRILANGLDGAQHVECADIDGDGLLDIVVATYLGREVSWIRSLGMGNWGAPTSVQGGIVRLIMAVPSDVDGDGDVDLLSISDNLGVALHRNLGGGTFASSVPLVSLVDNASNVEIADLDGDGWDDLAVTGTGDGMVAVARGDGTGAFDEGTAINVFGFVSSQHIASDLDGDGDLDFVVSGYGGTDSATAARGLLLVYPNGPSGLAPPQFVIRHSQDQRIDAVPVDLDGDGALDLLTAESIGPVHRLRWARNRGGLDFEAPRLILGLPNSNSPFHSLTIGDIDGDGDSDILSGQSGVVGWRPNLGSTSFGALQPLSFASNTDVRSFHLVDLDADGDLDIVRSVMPLTNGSGYSGALLHENTGSGNFTAARTLWLTSSSADYASADLDGDGDLDLYPSSSYGDPPRWVEQINLNSWVTHDLLNVAGQSYMTPADLDGDGDLDLVVTLAPAVGTRSTFENLGGGNFGPAIPLGLGINRAVYTHDVDGDGDDDLTCYRGLGVGWSENLRLTGPIGTSYCDPAVQNSTGAPGQLRADGTPGVSANRFRLTASDLPAQALTLFLASRHEAFIAQPGGSQGNLCLGGAIGRGVGGIVTSGSGTVSVSTDLTAMPQPMGPVTVFAGATWRFQCWHRDAIGGVATSNFTNGLAVRFE